MKKSIMGILFELLLKKEKPMNKTTFINYCEAILYGIIGGIAGGTAGGIVGAVLSSNAGWETGFFVGLFVGYWVAFTEERHVQRYHSQN